jgi:predicted nucleic-acid-binding Zn-ribbon protein
MYYSKKDLERLGKEAEEEFKRQEAEVQKEAQGFRYNSRAGLQITCPHCKNDRFLESKALLNTRGMTFFNLDWLNDDACILICKRCGNISWFYSNVEKIEDD